MRPRALVLAVTAVLGVAIFPGCPPSPPAPPSPAPTPPPGPPALNQAAFLELLLRAPSPPALTRGGAAFQPFGAIQCCEPLIQTTGGGQKPRRPVPLRIAGQPVNSRWPLASEAWMDYTGQKGANFFHHRMGPFFGDAAHEAEWADVGGPYLAGGLEWNPAFWDEERFLTWYAGWRWKANVEKVVVDTWYCKHAQWGDQEMPWPAVDIEACGRRASPEQERFIRKVVSNSTCLGNVVYSTDNEGDQIAGATRAWFNWVVSVIRDEEQRNPCQPTGTPIVHMIGTNHVGFGDDRFDYVATHARAPLTQPFYGKHSANNERNPHFSPDEEVASFCGARSAGLHWWFWRATMSDTAMEEVLSRFGQGCGQSECFAPPPEPADLWEQPPAPGGGPVMRSAVESAKLAVGERCGTDHQGSLETLGLLAAELRRRGHCASGPWVDALAILAPDGRWHEYHAVRFADGCWAQDQSQLPKFSWRYLGQNPAPQGCPIAVPTVDEILCRLHQPTNGIYDCTPKAGGQPILPEGDPRRQACELKAMGGAPPTFSLAGAATLELVPRSNPLQFQIRGSGSGTVSCTVPTVAGPLCNTPVSR